MGAYCLVIPVGRVVFKFQMGIGAYTEGQKRMKLFIVGSVYNCFYGEPPISVLFNSDTSILHSYLFAFSNVKFRREHCKTVSVATKTAN